MIDLLYKKETDLEQFAWAKQYLASNTIYTGIKIMYRQLVMTVMMVSNNS